METTIKIDEDDDDRRLAMAAGMVEMAMIVIEMVIVSDRRRQ